MPLALSDRTNIQRTKDENTLDDTNIVKKTPSKSKQSKTPRKSTRKSTRTTRRPVLKEVDENVEKVLGKELARLSISGATTKSGEKGEGDDQQPKSSNSSDNDSNKENEAPATEEEKLIESMSKMTCDSNKSNPFKSKITVQKNVKRAYQIINKMTGKIGGNGHGGAIYGELTVGSMQKMINLMKEHTDFNAKSRFIDVGCGLGKPNIHVAQDPGCEFSYGIEMEEVRWLLGMHNLNHVLRDAKNFNKKAADETEVVGHRCVLEVGNIKQAGTFDPFTHVYMFDIGFPPTLFHQLANMFNESQSNYLICFHGPKLMIERYGFDVELIVQIPTSMYGSGEGHQGYIYKRTKMIKENKKVKCDPLFEEAWDLCKEASLEEMSEKVRAIVHEKISSDSIATRTRSGARRAEKQGSQ